MILSSKISYLYVVIAVIFIFLLMQHIIIIEPTTPKVSNNPTDIEIPAIIEALLVTKLFIASTHV